MGVQYNEKQLANMQAAYQVIFGLTEKEVSTKEHQKRMREAIKDVHQYAGCFENEDETLAARRRAIPTDSPTNFVQALVKHFKMLYPNRFKSKSMYKVLYEMYSSMNSSETEKGRENEPVGNNVDAATAGRPGVDGDSDKETNNEITEKERKEDEMAKTLEDSLKEIKNGTLTPAANDGEPSMEEIKKAGNGTTVVKGSNVKAPDAMNAAARKDAEAKAEILTSNSMNTLVEKFIISTRPLEQRLKEGKSAKGWIPEAAWERVFKKFCENTGYNPDSKAFEGDKLAQGELDNAEKMLAQLKAAEADKTQTFDINESKSTGSIKGFSVKKPGAGDAMYLKKDELRDYLFNETRGFVRTAVEGSVVQLAKAKSLATAQKKASDALVSCEDIKDTSGLVTLKVTGRQDMIDADKGGSHIMYWREVDEKETEEAAGCKSAISVKCRKRSKDGEKIIDYTYRLPLTALMKKTQVKDEGLKAKFGEAGQGIGHKFDPNDAGDLKKLDELMFNVYAVAAASGINNSRVNDIRNLAASAEQAVNNEVAAQFD